MPWHIDDRLHLCPLFCGADGQHQVVHALSAAVVSMYRDGGAITRKVK